MKITQLAVVALAGAALAAAPVLASAQGLLDPPVFKGEWNDPQIIQTAPVKDRLFLSYSGAYGEYKSRKLELTEFTLGGRAADWLSLWYSRQNFLLKGRQATSRLRLDDDRYGFRATLKKPKDDDLTSLAFQFEYVRTSSARLQAGASSAVYPELTGYELDLNFHDGRKTDFQLIYSWIEGRAGGRAQVYGVGVGQGTTYRNIDLRAQARLLGQTWSSAVSSNSRSLEVKPVLDGFARYRISRILALEGGVTVFPAGIPFATSRYSGLGGFQIYEPGGVAAGLKNDFVAIGSLRLVAGFSF